MQRVVRIHGLSVVIAMAACGRVQIVEGVSDSAFVSTMAQLRRVQNDASLDSAARAAARAAVLQGQGLTAAQLERAAAALAADPDRATDLWRRIDQRVAAPLRQ